MDQAFNKNGMLFPMEYRKTDNPAIFSRLVIDYISRMMDTFAIFEYKKYFGSNSLDGIYYQEKN